MSEPAFDIDDLTVAQREELDRRLDEIDRGETSGIPWDEVLARLRNQSP